VSVLRLLCLLLAAAPLAADPAFRDFDAYVAKHGLAAAVRPMRAFEDRVEELREAVEREHETFAKLSDDWWGWRRKYERDYRRRHKRPPVDWPVPDGLNRSFIQAEDRFGDVRSKKLNEEIFQASVVRKFKEAVKGGTDGDVLEALGKGLRSRNPHQQIRCARILRHAGEAARPFLEKATRGERHPVVLGELLRAHGGVEFLTSFLDHRDWPVRAGALAGLGKDVPEGHEETGRLREDLAWARGKPCEAAVDVLGVRTASLAVVFVFDASSEQMWEGVKPHAKRAVEALPDEADVAVVMQGGEKPRVHKGGSKKKALRFLDRHEVRPGPDLARALKEAFELAGRGRGSRAAKFDTLFVVQPVPPRKPQLAPYKNTYVRPREITLEVLPWNDLRGLRIHGIGRSGGGSGYYLEDLAAPFDGTPRRE